jgi:hypothetical protein
MTKRQKEVAAAAEIPRYFPGEQDAIRTVRELGARYGYGNLISRLKDAWSEHLQATSGLSKKSGDLAAGHVCVWCNVDWRTGKKAR